jgi:Ran-binding protein 1
MPCLAAQVRLLMRREKTMKICANFFVGPTIDLKVNAGSDRSWVWQCHDFSEEKTDVTTLAIRFANSENAQKFKDEFEKAKKANEGQVEGAGEAAGTTEDKAKEEEKPADKPKEDTGATEKGAEKEEAA